MTNKDITLVAYHNSLFLIRRVCWSLADLGWCIRYLQVGWDPALGWAWLGCLSRAALLHGCTTCSSPRWGVDFPEWRQECRWVSRNKASAGQGRVLMQRHFYLFYWLNKYMGGEKYTLPFGEELQRHMRRARVQEGWRIRVINAIGLVTPLLFIFKHRIWIKTFQLEAGESTPCKHSQVILMQ